jgi:sugar phosphate isomerase/epimerase
VLWGVTTMTFYHRPILEAVEFIGSCGFDCVEIWADHAWDEKKGASAAKLKGALARWGLQSTVHCPVLDVNIASPNRGIREESLRQYRAALDLAKELGARLVVLHPGRKSSPREAAAAHWSYQVEAMGRILPYAEELGVVAAVENMDSDQALYSVQQWAHLDQLFADCASAQRWVCLDTAHLQDTSAVLSFIHQAGPCIAHVHLSDATGQHLHLPVGQGSLDIPRIVSALHSAGYQGIYSLECFIPNNTPEKLGAELARVKELLS